MRHLLFLLALFCSLASAAPVIVSITSDGTLLDPFEWNSMGPNITIVPHSAWYGPLPGSSWVSYTQSGDPNLSGFVIVPEGHYTFTQQFSLAGLIPVNGYLNVLADDTTSVYLNGNLLVLGNFIGPFPTCAIPGPGCLNATMATITFSQMAPYLLPGINTLTFDVYQAYTLVSFGLNYSGQIEAVPEANTMMLIGTGLLLIGSVQRLRKLFSK